MMMTFLLLFNTADVSISDADVLLLPTYQIPSVWGPVSKAEDPYAPPAEGCKCIVM